MTEADPTSAGRPSKLTAEIKKQVIKLALLGCTDKEICSFIEVDESTMTRWKQKDSKFYTSLKEAKLNSDLEVISSLRKRAIGYEEEDTKIFNDQGTPLVVPYTKKVAPDPTSAIFWLKNRQPEKFRDKQQEINIGSDKSGKIEVQFNERSER